MMVIPGCCPDERWASLVGWEGAYEISTCGRVISLPRSFTNARGRTTRVKGGLFTVNTASEYLTVALSDARQHRTCTVLIHQQVMRTFVGVPAEGQEVCHDDGNPHNAHLANLRYGTRKENAADRARHGTVLYGDRHPNRRLGEAEVRQIIHRLDAGEKRLSLAAEFGVSYQAICKIDDGTNWAWLSSQIRTVSA